jgi:hypothetical protein
MRVSLNLSAMLDFRCYAHRMMPSCSDQDKVQGLRSFLLRRVRPGYTTTVLHLSLTMAIITDRSHVNTHIAPGVEPAGLARLEYDHRGHSRASHTSKSNHAIID